jgi:hypothetical protein
MSMFAQRATGDALNAPRNHPGCGKESPMNILAYYVANEMLQTAMDQAVDWSMTHSLPARPSLRDRVVSAVGALRRLIGNPVESAGVLPRLEDYPYRG